jgi:hypothetical protein
MFLDFHVGTYISKVLAAGVLPGTDPPSAGLSIIFPDDRSMARRQDYAIKATSCCDPAKWPNHYNF